MELLESSISSVQDGCAKLGKILGLDGPVNERVLHGALDDPAYAQHLLRCRRNPAFISYLLENPPQSAAPPLATLLTSAARAFSDWARAGFTTVDDTTLQRRLAACADCPNLRGSPDDRKLLYAMLGARGNSPAVCRLCGCVVANKARLSTESCPDRDPNDLTKTRWGEDQ